MKGGFQRLLSGRSQVWTWAAPNDGYWPEGSRGGLALWPRLEQKLADLGVGCERPLTRRLKARFRSSRMTACSQKGAGQTGANLTLSVSSSLSQIGGGGGGVVGKVELASVYSEHRAPERDVCSGR